MDATTREDRLLGIYLATKSLLLAEIYYLKNNMEHFFQVVWHQHSDVENSHANLEATTISQ